MTDLRTAAQQALEALEYHVEQTRPIHRTSEAIAALRAALAQQAEAVEPVAWMDPASGDVISDARHEAWERDFGLAGKGKAALFTVPLYTAPPQRKPLTQEEIPALAEKAWTPSVYCDAEALLGTDGLVALVRAVEAKHNIKE